MASQNFQSLCESLTILIKVQNFATTTLTLRQALQAARTRSDYLQIQTISQNIPNNQLSNSVLAELLATLTYRTGSVKRYQEICQHFPEQLQIFQAWINLEKGNWQLAQQQSRPAANSNHSDIAWRIQARASFHLEDPQWQEIYTQAFNHLTGRQKGLCLLEYGTILTFKGKNSEARSVYANAFHDLKNDPYFAAMLQHNLGMACIRIQDFQAAENAFQKTMKYAKYPEANDFLSAAWCGLGSVRRAYQEYPRALHAFEQANTKASTDVDRIHAARNLGHTKRLMLDTDGALAAFEEARRFIKGKHELYAEIAAAKLQNNDLLGAIQALEMLSENDESENQRAIIVKAEIQRRQKNKREAKKLLAQIDMTSVWASEEAQVFPELFALHKKQHTFQAMQIRINTDGAIQVFINNRPLPIKPLATSSSLLALLCLEHGKISVDRAIENLNPKESDPRNENQYKRALYKTVDELREILGWKNAVCIQAKIISLETSPFVQWNELETPPSERTELFCEGHDNNWVRQWRETHMRI